MLFVKVQKLRNGIFLIINDIKADKMTKRTKIIYSNRKTLSIEIKSDLQVIVRAPNNMKKADVQKFIDEKSAWIEKHLEKIKTYTSENEHATAFSQAELKTLCEQAQKVIPPIVNTIAKSLDVTYGRITIRKQVSRWGSCSAKGNLNFNCMLMLCPKDVVEYVIIHELCHRKYMNHSKDFWAAVEMYCPDYKACKKWLKEDGNKLISRLRII